MKCLLLRLAIMKEGKIYCQGTLPKLKEKFGKGYTVLLKLKYSGDEDELSEVVVEEVDGRMSRQNSSGSASAKDVEAVMNKMKELYGTNCRLRDKHKVRKLTNLKFSTSFKTCLGFQCLLHYHIENAEKKWSALFSEIESLKLQFPIIEDYSISDASLEDVFMEIAKCT